MTNQYDIRRHSDLHVRIQPFAEIAADMVVALNLEKSGGRGPKGEPASDRAIRDYVRRRVLSPTLRGPDTDERGYYGFRHLVEFLAARVLLNDGWPLEKIAERNRLSTTDELIALIPGQAVVTDAVALARSFRSRPSGYPNGDLFPARSVASAPAPRSASYAPPMAASAPPPLEEMSDLAAWAEPTVSPARSRAELPLLMRQLTQSERPPRVAQLARIALGDQVTLLIDQDLVRHITPGEADLIGRTVSAALLDYQNLSRPRRTENDD